MCGLFGFLRAGNNKVILRDYLQNMTLAGTLRGSESVGFYFGAPNLGHIEKFPMNGSLVAYSKVMPNLTSMANASNILIGHHRASTHGEISTTNCHPFQRMHEDKTIIGAHNGVISSFNRQEAGRTFVVDSDWAMYKLAEMGDEAFKLFEGAYALSYYDVKKGTFTLVCNESRPLWYAYVKKDNAMFYASEWGMLAWVADRNDIYLEEITQIDAFDKHEFPFADPRAEVVSKVSDFVRPKAQTSFPHRFSGHAHSDWGLDGDDYYHYNYFGGHRYKDEEPSAKDTKQKEGEFLLASQTEADLAEAHGILGQPCDVMASNPEQVTERTTVCHAIGTIGADTESVIIRGINKNNWWKVSKGTILKATIVGAKWMAPSNEPDAEKSFYVIVGPPTTVRFSGSDKKQFLIAADLEVMSRLKSGSSLN